MGIAAARLSFGLKLAAEENAQSNGRVAEAAPPLSSGEVAKTLAFAMLSGGLVRRLLRWFPAGRVSNFTRRSPKV
jgi:hypothetical protein